MDGWMGQVSSQSRKCSSSPDDTNQQEVAAVDRNYHWASTLSSHLRNCSHMSIGHKRVTRGPSNTLSISRAPFQLVSSSGRNPELTIHATSFDNLF
jgi:hypothetical protein